MKSKTLFAALLLFVFFVSFGGYASTIIQTEQIDYHVPGYTAALTFDRYDEGVNGPLASVQVIFSTWMYEGSLEWDNDSTENAAVGGTLGVRSALTSGVVRLDNGSGNPFASVFNTITDNFVLDPTTGDPTDEFNRTFGVDYVSLPGPASNVAQFVTVSAYIDAAYLSDFVGAGTYTLNYQAWQHQSTWTEGGTHSETAPSTAIANIQVIYTSIPEPSALALIGLAGIGIVYFRRRRIG